MTAPLRGYVDLPQVTPVPYLQQLNRILDLIPKNSWHSADSLQAKGLIINHESQADKDYAIQELLKDKALTLNPNGTYMFEGIPVTFNVN